MQTYKQAKRNKNTHTRIQNKQTKTLKKISAGFRSHNLRNESQHASPLSYPANRPTSSIL